MSSWKTKCTHLWSWDWPLGSSGSENSGPLSWNWSVPPCAPRSPLLPASVSSKYFPSGVFAPVALRCFVTHSHSGTSPSRLPRTCCSFPTAGDFSPSAARSRLSGGGRLPRAAAAAPLAEHLSRWDVWWPETCSASPPPAGFCCGQAARPLGWVGSLWMWDSPFPPPASCFLKSTADFWTSTLPRSCWGLCFAPPAGHCAFSGFLCHFSARHWLSWV